MEEVELDNILYYIDEDNRSATVYRISNHEYEGKLEIPQCIWDDGHMYEVREIADFAFDGCEGLESIDIPDAVTEIGDWAFCGCTSLQTVDIPNSVSEIGKSAFLGCKSLQSIDIPDSVTRIGMEAFKGCTSLQSVDIPNSVSEIGKSAFEGCTSCNPSAKYRLALFLLLSA